MTPEVERLFHELADLSREQRKEYYTVHAVDGAVQSELEKLLSFDAAALDQFLGDAIRSAASRTVAGLETDHEAGTRFGQYRILGLLGQGGMGAVYRAERADGEIVQQVAIKTLRPAMGHPGWQDRFIRERQLLAQLNHPSIARLYDAGHTEAGQPYLVMEYVDGIPIDEYAAGRSLMEQIGLMVEVCDAVTYAHRNLIIHRDLKPSNILVEKSGRPKLLDFGIAKLVDDEGGSTETVDRMLTPTYASPEQIRGEPQTTATDVYSLGAILYRLVTGRSPHEDEEHRRLAMEIAAGKRDVIPPRRLNQDLPLDADLIVMKALRLDQAERYPSVESFADDLRRFVQHKPIRARPESLSYRAAKFVRRNRVAVALAGIALLASVAGVAATLIQAQAARAQRDFAIRHLARAEEIGELNSFLLSDAAPLGKPLNVNDLLGIAESIAERQSGSDPVSRVEILTSVGSQYLFVDEEAMSRRVLERAYELSRSVSDPSLRSRAACSLARSLSRLTSEVARANRLATEALLELPDDPMYALDRSHCLQDAAAIARNAGGGEDAVAKVRAAWEALKQAPYRSRVRELSLMLDLAESYRIAGNLRDSAATSEQAAALMTSLGRDRTQRAGTLYNNWALTLNELGRQLEAEKIYQRAIQISAADANEGSVSPMLLLNYGRVLTDLGRHREAEGYVRRAYDMAKRKGSELIVAQSLIVMAAACRGLGDPKRAILAIDEFDSVCRRVFPPGHVAYASMTSQRSLNAQARGDLPGALELANRAVALTEEGVRAGHGDGFLPIVLLRRSDIELPLHLTEVAVNDARRALEIFQKQAQPGSLSSFLGRSYLSLGRALRQQGDPTEARKMFRSAQEHLNQSIGPEHPDTLEAARLALL